MNTKSETKEVSGKDFSPEGMFNLDLHREKEYEEEDDDIKDFPNFNMGNDDEDEEDEEEQNFDDDEEDDDDSSFGFDDDDNDDGKDEKSDVDIESFNKKFNTNFKTDEELKSFISEKEKATEDSNDERDLENAKNQINFLEPLLKIGEHGYIVSNEDLMKKDFEAIAIANKQDLNDEDVQLEIQDKIEDLKYKGVLDLYAENLRTKLSNIVSEANNSKTKIESKKESLRLLEEKTKNELIQNELVSFHSNKNFYGVELDKNVVKDSYKGIVSGEFIKQLQSDPRMLAELSLMFKVKEKIFKKSSGLTYNDGMKAILDEFKSKDKSNPVVKAQQRSRSTAGGDTQKGLIDSMLYTKPKTENK